MLPRSAARAACRAWWRFRLPDHDDLLAHAEVVAGVKGKLTASGRHLMMETSARPAKLPFHAARDPGLMHLAGLP